MACTEIKLDARFAHLAMNHPCLGRAENRARLHLPVSPACNIKCRFCTRSFNCTENRPGVTRQVLPVEEACDIVEKATRLCPELSVVGIAGPGDTLATEHALRSFEQLCGRFPHLIGCMSTNGLLLPEYADRIAKSGVKSVTVTVNAVDSEIWTQIVESIQLGGKTYTGTEAGTYHILRQLWGIRQVSARDILVKINTVLIPGINDAHIEKIASVTAGLGASIINIIPLIPQGEFAYKEPPTCAQLNEARESAEKYLPVFRHCQHCRADACGILGKTDVSGQLYENLSCENTFSHG